MVLCHIIDLETMPAIVDYLYPSWDESKKRCLSISILRQDQQILPINNDFETRRNVAYLRSPRNVAYLNRSWDKSIKCCLFVSMPIHLSARNDRTKYDFHLSARSDRTKYDSFKKLRSDLNQQKNVWVKNSISKYFLILHLYTLKNYNYNTSGLFLSNVISLEFHFRANASIDWQISRCQLYHTVSKKLILQHNIFICWVKQTLVWVVPLAWRCTV